MLQETKTTAQEVNQKLKIAEVTEKKIMIAREEYRGVATRGSILYFLIVELSAVNIMYQNSLKQFLVIFDNSITKSQKSSITEERINIILKYLTYEVWAFTSRSLYERHKLLFTLMLAIKIDYQRGHINHEEFMTFIKGGASLDLNAVAPKPFKWILDITWLNLVEISKLPAFNDILKKIEQNERDWKLWYEAEKPEMEEIPCGYQTGLDVFRKLLLVRSWSPDRTISQARRYIEGTFLLVETISSIFSFFQSPSVMNTVKCIFWTLKPLGKNLSHELLWYVFCPLAQILQHKLELFRRLKISVSSKVSFKSFSHLRDLGRFAGLLHQTASILW